MVSHFFILDLEIGRRPHFCAQSGAAPPRVKRDVMHYMDYMDCMDMH